MKHLSAMLLCDMYKISHREQYPDKTQIVYSTWTPRTSRIDGVDKVVAFGFQSFVKKYLINFFNEHFFSRDKKAVVSEYKRVITSTLGEQSPYTKHIEELHDLGYLPLHIKAIPEGTLVPLKVPMLTIHNTDPRFYWLTNYIETLGSCEMWQASTSATISFQYRKLLDKYAKETNGSVDFVDFQGHDFSMRGMSSLESAMSSGAGHLLSFLGTDTIPAILYTEAYYNANIEKEMIGTSIPATEHSVMCSYGKDEFNSYKRIITEIYPNGPVSIVSDTWDLWKVISEVITPLKETILARNGGPNSLDKVVIRPDSGDPVKIICGDPDATEGSMERKGVIECLWDIFGGTVNSKGYKELDPHIGCIYGDAITLSRCQEICENLKEKGFASTNMVYGIGSFTYQYNTRDTFGFALKSTLCIIDGEEVQIYKDPITDNGIKKSAKGAVRVESKNGKLVLKDGLFLEEVNSEKSESLDELKTLFKDGKLIIDESFSNIRNRLKNVQG